MEITLEQVERLREKAAVSYGQAKAALEYSGGNLRRFSHFRYHGEK